MYCWFHLTSNKREREAWAWSVSVWSVTAQRTSTSTRLHLYKHTHADTLASRSFEVRRNQQYIVIFERSQLQDHCCYCSLFDASRCDPFTDVQWLLYLQDHCCYCLLFDASRCDAFTAVQWLLYLQDHCCYCLLFDASRCDPFTDVTFWLSYLISKNSTAVFQLVCNQGNHSVVTNIINLFFCIQWGW